MTSHQAHCVLGAFARSSPATTNGAHSLGLARQGFWSSAIIASMKRRKALARADAGRCSQSLIGPRRQVHRCGEYDRPVENQERTAANLKNALAIPVRLSVSAWSCATPRHL